jgi:hypothetical protein
MAIQTNFHVHKFVRRSSERYRKKFCFYASQCYLRSSAHQNDAWPRTTEALSTVRNCAHHAHFRENRLHSLHKFKIRRIESTLKKVTTDQLFRYKQETLITTFVTISNYDYRRVPSIRKVHVYSQRFPLNSLNGRHLSVDVRLTVPCASILLLSLTRPVDSRGHCAADGGVWGHELPEKIASARSQE